MTTRKYLFPLFLILVCAVIVLVSCVPTVTEVPAATEASATEAPIVSESPDVDPMAELVAAAQAEGMLTTIALQHNWCNYGEVIETFKSKYGLEVHELNPDAGFGEEIAAIKASKQNKSMQAPDVIDVGFSFGPTSQDEGLLMPYKVSTWDSIPDDVKDLNGYWYGAHYWVLSFLVNTDVQPDVPHDWADLLDPKYTGQVALSGDPRKSNQAIQTIFAAALANGGSLDDAWAGLDFFAKLNTAGNLAPWIATNSLVVSGETPVRITWDYNALTAIDSFKGNPAAEVVIPASGRFASVNVQAISAYAPHPNAAKLWMEFLYSDEGQTLWMKGYCHPIREADMHARGVIPREVFAKMPDVSGAVFPTLAQLDAARTFITNNWDSVVSADIQAAP
ncbi:MAG TPA: extracellular solute-binding protein [Anaerolineales bacterium]|nr:extracellular solute-binding protein [Anaerolineales bacterium]